MSLAVVQRHRIRVNKQEMHKVLNKQKPEHADATSNNIADCDCGPCCSKRLLSEYHDDQPFCRMLSCSSYNKAFFFRPDSNFDVSGMYTSAPSV